MSKILTAALVAVALLGSAVPSSAKPAKASHPHHQSQTEAARDFWDNQTRSGS